MNIRRRKKKYQKGSAELREDFEKPAGFRGWEEGKVCVVLFHRRNSPPKHWGIRATAGLGPETVGGIKSFVF